HAYSRSDPRLEGRVQVLLKKVARLLNVHVTVDKPQSFFHGILRFSLSLRYKLTATSVPRSIVSTKSCRSRKSTSTSRSPLKSEVGKESPRQTDPRTHCSPTFSFPPFSTIWTLQPWRQPNQNYMTWRVIPQDLPPRLFRNARQRFNQ